MMLKASLHIHTIEDRVEGHLIKYNIYELIDWAEQLGFKVLGLTCHKQLVYKESYVNYAASRGILLLLGVELQMKKRIKLSLGNNYGILHISCQTCLSA